VLVCLRIQQQTLLLPAWVKQHIESVYVTVMRALEWLCDVLFYTELNVTHLPLCMLHPLPSAQRFGWHVQAVHSGRQAWHIQRGQRRTQLLYCGDLHCLKCSACRAVVMMQCPATVALSVVSHKEASDLLRSQIQAQA
jgi:hypothetical protein